MNVLTTILNSEKIHLTQSEKNFIKETFEILSIFSEETEKIFLQKYNEIINSKKNKFVCGKEFFVFAQKLRYPISFDKIQQIKKFFAHKKLSISNLEFNEEILDTQQNLQKIKKILTKL